MPRHDANTNALFSAWVGRQLRLHRIGSDPPRDTRPDDARDDLTRAATHELAEGATDEGPGGWRLTPAETRHPWGPALIPVPGDPDGGLTGTSPFAVGEGTALA